MTRTIERSAPQEDAEWRASNGAGAQASGRQTSVSTGQQVRQRSLEQRRARCQVQSGAMLSAAEGTAERCEERLFKGRRSALLGNQRLASSSRLEREARKLRRLEMVQRKTSTGSSTSQQSSAGGTEPEERGAALSRRWGLSRRRQAPTSGGLSWRQFQWPRVQLAVRRLREAPVGGRLWSLGRLKLQQTMSVDDDDYEDIAANEASDDELHELYFQDPLDDLEDERLQEQSNSEENLDGETLDAAKLISHLNAKLTRFHLEQSATSSESCR